MTPEFVKAVDPIVEMMVDVKEQIEKNAAPQPDYIRSGLIHCIQLSRESLRDRPSEWDLAQYALVAWIDEQLATSLAWPGASFWSKNKLQLKYYRCQLSREGFFERAAEAEKIEKKDALEVFFLCVVLGFKGVYDGTADRRRPQDLGLPDTLAEWQRRMRDCVKLTPAKVVEKRGANNRHGTTPLYGKYQFLGTLMTFVIMTIYAVLLAYAWIKMPK